MTKRHVKPEQIDVKELLTRDGDYLRMIMNRVVKTAKEVYTHTNISRNPISVVSLAYRKLRELNTCANARILIVGAGETNTTISK